MNNPLAVIGPFLVLGFAIVAIPVGLKMYRRLRGQRSVICPENGKHETIEVNAGYAAITSTVGRTEIEVRRCSRWPEHRECGQACREQLR